MVNLILRAVPILRAKSVKAHVADVVFAAILEKLDDALAGFFVAKITRKSSRFGPSSVPVHDKGDVVEFLRKKERRIHGNDYISLNTAKKDSAYILLSSLFLRQSSIQKNQKSLNLRLVLQGFS